MTTDGNVQPGVTSEQGVPSTPGAVTTPTVPTAPTQPSPTIDEAKVAELVAKEAAKFLEQAKREIQSVKDKSRAEIESALTRVRQTEDSFNLVRQRLREVDPNQYAEAELARYQAQETTRRQQELEEVAKRQQAEFHSRFQTGLKAIVTELGVDPEDKRIDWAVDAPDYLEAQERILKSATKIKREIEITKEKTLQDNLQTQIKAIESKLRKDLGMDSVDTTTPGGVPTDNTTDAFIKKVANGEKLTKDEYKRAKELGLG